jgi:flavorubredoxin
MSITRIDEVEAGIYRVSTPTPAVPGGFSFNQYLVLDDEPLVFHTGPRGMFPDVSAAIARVVPLDRLRWIAFSHFEQDESGALAEFLAAAPKARALCSQIAAMVGNGDFTNREPKGMADGEQLTTGRRSLRWMATPHVPHGWDCGLLLDATSRTLFCGDLFTQGGLGETACTEGDILGPSEAFRQHVDYFAHAPVTREVIEKLAKTEPKLLACMHGAAWRGDGARLLRGLAAAVAG